MPVWWAPTTGEEANLPAADPFRPARADRPRGDRGRGPARTRAVALFQLWGDEPGEIVVVGSDGASYSLDVSRLEPVIDRGGNESPRGSPETLSPDGRYALFRQSGSIEVYDFHLGTWTTIATADDAFPEAAGWEGNLIQAPEFAIDPDAQLYEPTGEAAGRSYGLGDAYIGPKARDDMYGPIKRIGSWGSRGLYAGPSAQALGAGGRTQPEALLAMPVETEGGRWNQCCPVVGWLDPETVLFESRHEEARILAWRVGTEDLYRVSDILGWTPGEESYVASFADLD